MPSAFENVLAPSAEVWTPLQYDMSLGRRGAITCAWWGGCGQESAPDQATKELDVLAHAVWSTRIREASASGWVHREFAAGRRHAA